jgi:YD repeat-containing protein
LKIITKRKKDIIIFILFLIVLLSSFSFSPRTFSETNNDLNNLNNGMVESNTSNISATTDTTDMLIPSNTKELEIDLESDSNAPVLVDTFEPNDTISEPHIIEIGKSYTSVINLPSDIDYYKVIPNKTGTLQIDITEGDIDLLDSTGAIVNKSGTGYSVVLEKEYFIKIYSSKNSAFEYNLTLHEVVSSPLSANISSTLTTPIKKQYKYNVNNQLTEIKTGNELIKMNYDANGNLLGRTSLISKGTIESPTNGSNLIKASGESINLTGWFLDPYIVEKIEVFNDNVLLGNATIGIQREDIYNLHPNYQNHNAGFKYEIIFNSTTSKTYNLKLVVTNKVGATTELITSFTVQPNNKLISKGAIEEPTDGSVLNKSTGELIAIKGWYLDPEKVDNIKVYNDDVLLGNATIGIQREDIYTAHPEYQDHNAGFEYAINFDSTISKTYNLKFEITNKAGVKTELRTSFTVDPNNKLISKGAIEEPIDGSVLNNSIGELITIKGWFLDPEMVDNIKVYNDDALLGNATIGIQREDIYTAYPEYQDHNAGFEYAIDFDSTESKTYNLKFEITNKAGTKTELRTSFTVQPTVTLESIGAIEQPVNDSTISIPLGTTFLLKGWALDPYGVSKIEIYDNETFLGNATLGLLREDIYNAYPEYQNHNSGFYLDIMFDSVFTKTYNLKLVITNNNGDVSILTTTFRVTKGKPEIGPDPPDPAS